MTRPAWSAAFDLAGSAAHRRAYLIRRVREGVTVRAAAAEIPVAIATTSRWRRESADFAASLDHAKRMSMAKRSNGGAKARILELMASGMNAGAAAAQLGMARSTPSNWARTDPEFGAAYSRMVGPCRRTDTTLAMHRMLGLLAGGAGLEDARRAVGLHYQTVAGWRQHDRPQWAMVQRAMAAGAALREGRAA